MAETEPVVEQSERPERNNEPIVYDESLLIIVKGKVQQPKQPDHTESRLLIQKLQAEITKRGDRIKEIKTIEEQLRSNAKGVSSGNKEIISKLKELRDQRATIIRQKAAIRDELNNCDAARDAVRAEMRSIRDKNRNVNPDKIEQDIRDLEFKLAHESLPEAEEKRVQKLLQDLTAARPLAKKYAEYDSRLKESEVQRASIIARLKESDGVIAQFDAQIAANSAVLDDARTKADSHAADLPNLQARKYPCLCLSMPTGTFWLLVEKKENYDIMVALRAKIDEIKKQNDAEYQDFIKRDRAYMGWKRDQNRKKYEERQKEREERERQRQDENKAILSDVAMEPYSNEIFTCDQMLTYLRSFTAVKEEVKEEVKTVEVPAGLKPFKRQEVVDEMFTGVPKRTPQGKGAKNAPAPAKPAETPKPKVQKLNHTLDMLKVFLQLQVEPPTTTSAIPATIEAVEARKVEYKEKQEEAKRAPPPARVAPPPAPTPEANGSHKSGGKEVEVEVEDEPAEAEAEATPEPEAPSAAPEVEEEPAAVPAVEAEKAPSSSAPAEEEEEPAETEEKAESAPEPAEAEETAGEADEKVKEKAEDEEDAEGEGRNPGNGGGIGRFGLEDARLEARAARSAGLDWCAAVMRAVTGTQRGKAATPQQPPLDESRAAVDRSGTTEGPFLAAFQPLTRDLVRTRTNLQLLDLPRGRAENLAEFAVAGRWEGALNIVGTAMPQPSGPQGAPSASRVDVVFSHFELRLGGPQNKVTIPLGWLKPKGWIETTYLDNDLRIGRGDKGSIFVASSGDGRWCAAGREDALVLVNVMEHRPYQKAAMGGE
ncbi:hypothetical protein VOLCADRAFT_121362 [Volvox carteri f. nagariensis]|uniref:Plastid lipid-associated protein/fibrillin conserved domain-containing protein n=1 Tax=Volvox carteri f. nagariensis TaxID=3068 RepID=D8U8D9_VOLCA|nr:uncharacterized protein VOLCADRAFT_121362 [Volvox carteri f. nagariensis]EFJ43960.1 hypothetical protein VOLCADRAFT_121362 [Volvox carteri f. nagariensis]|eukprot:XP_002954972.1 hypothetical protein VOLCADRAFT_121362 [Volvox carteri f. nagariensis]